jgi:hypothetical protein
MLISALVSLVTGVVLGWSSKWGLVRYWWVGTKLALNLLLCVLIVFLLQPGMDEVGEHGRELQDGSTTAHALPTLFFPPSVSLSLLTLATVLAVFKPWGRTRRNRRPAPRS